MINDLYDYIEMYDYTMRNLPIKPRTDVFSKIKEYHEIVKHELIYGYHLATMDQIKHNQVPFNLTNVKKKLGRFGNNSNSDYHWWDWFHKHFPLIEVHKKGNSIQGVRTMVSPKEMPIEIILASGDNTEIVKAVYSQFDLESEIDIVPIDTRSLENYIAATTAQNSDNKTIKNNLKDAKIILSVAQEMDGHLAQIVSHSSFGRKYYKGINLQNVHKTVRHAALGNCYSIDINNAVFNWKYSAVPFQRELINTRELIQDKKRVRKQLANLVFGNASERSINTIKQTLTAISFGARAESKCWFKKEGKWTQGAVSEIITSKDLRDVLFNDEWMREFMKEQKKINDYIGDGLMEAAKSGMIPEETLKDLRSERGRLSKGKLIAWAYQQSEQDIMSQMLEHANAEVLLQVHDGIYFKTKPNVLSMNTILQDNWKLATLKIEEITRYAYVDRNFDAEHERIIREQELIANDGVMPAKPKLVLDNKLHDPVFDDPDYEKNMMQEFESHLNATQYPDFIRKMMN